MAGRAGHPSQNDELWSMLIMHDRAVMNNSFCLFVFLLICR
jgi:hypothetical protein